MGVRYLRSRPKLAGSSPVGGALFSILNPRRYGRVHPWWLHLRFIRTADSRDKGQCQTVTSFGGGHVKRTLAGLLILSAVLAFVAACSGSSGDATTGPDSAIPLKEAKLNIEHNATDNDTGFQGAIDSEGWKQLDVRGPDGRVLRLEGRGGVRQFGLTELCFESGGAPG